MSTSIKEINNNFNEDLNIQLNKSSNQIEGKDDYFCNFSDEQAGNKAMSYSELSTLNLKSEFKNGVNRIKI
jgi:hypothetical protein